MGLKLIRIASGLCLVAWFLAALVLEYWSMQLLVDFEEELEETVAKETLQRWSDGKKKIQNVNEGDEVQVYYAEHLLASWVLEASPWNAFHSAIVFRINDKETGKKKADYCIEFTPLFTSTIAPVLHPKLDPVYPEWMPPLLGAVFARLTSSYNIDWRNQGGVRYHDYIPKKLTNFTYIGKTEGKILNSYMDWLKTEYEENHKTFEPVEIIVNGSKSSGIGSSMCHDLFYYSLEALYDLGFKPNPSDMIFRDHIMVFANSYEEVDPNDPSTRKDIVRYFRLFMSFMPRINKEFTNIRNLLLESSGVGFTPYLFLGGKYYKVSLVDPYVNYCYLEVQMPPLLQSSNFFEQEKLCALEDKVTKSNITFVKKVTAFFKPNNLVYVTEYLVDMVDQNVYLLLISCYFVSLLLSVSFSNGQQLEKKKED